MLKPQVGDRVLCHLKGGEFVRSNDLDFDEVKSFDIIAENNSGFYLFIPNYIYLKGTFILSSTEAKSYDIDLKFVDEQVIHIYPSYVCSIASRMEGLFCARCKNFSQYAEPNQPDGSMLCWSCRSNPYT